MIWHGYLFVGARRECIDGDCQKFKPRLIGLQAASGDDAALPRGGKRPHGPKLKVLLSALGVLG